MRKVFSYRNMRCNVKLSLLLLLLTIAKSTGAQRLIGVTTRKWPFVERTLNQESKSDDKWIYSGYFVDLLNEIKILKPDFEYELYLARDSLNELVKMDTLIHELNINNADFAITDLTVTDLHEHLVDFTEPFLYTRTSALVRKSHACNLKTLEELAAQSSVKYGTVAGSITNYELNTDDPIKQSIFKTIEDNHSLFVHSFDDGLNRVNQTKYALITEETVAEYYANIKCDFTVISDTISDYTRKYAIALKKDSPYLGWFNSAIFQLKNNYVLEKLRREFFQNNCVDENDDYCRNSSSIESTLTELNAAFNFSNVYFQLCFLIIILIYNHYF